MASQSSENPLDVAIESSTTQFRINYSKARCLPFGESICSPIFVAGGYDWILEFYPQGTGPENGGFHPLVNLGLKSDVKEISVEYTIEIRNKMGKFVSFVSPKVVTFTNDGCGWADEIYHDTLETLYCVNGFLVISCSNTALTEPKIVQTYPGGLCEHIEKFWKKKETFDVTFEVDGENISAHRFMPAARSPVFEAQLFGPMVGAKGECIKIDEMKADVFKALLHFIYTDQLVNDNSSNQETLSVELFQDLMVAADRYALDKLTLLCEEHLEMNLSVDNVVIILFLADRHSRIKLKNKCLQFACSPENFSLVALTEGYINIMPGAPSLLAELSKRVKCLSHSAKKQKTG